MTRHSSHGRLQHVSVCLAVLVLAAAAAAAAAQPPSVTIGVVTDGPHGRGTEDQAAIRADVVELLSIDFQVELPDSKRLEGDWTLTGIQQAIDQQLADPDVDLVLTLGFVGSHLAALMDELPKPVIAPLVIDPDFQGLPRREAGSGVANLNYISVHDMGDLVALRDIAAFTHVALLVDARLVEAVPNAAQRARIAAGEMGHDVQLVPVGSSVDAALDAIDDDVDAVYVLPLLQLDDDAFGRLVGGLTQRRLPSISWIGEREVRQGVLAGRMPEGFVARLARRSALNAQRALLGDDLAQMAVAYPASVRLTFNLRTADAIGLSPSFTLLTEAELIDDPNAAARQLSFPEAVRDAVVANLDLRARERLVAAGAENINLAEALRGPRIDLDLDTRLIDDDRAAASFGSAPEWGLFGSATLTQLVYADEVWANVTIERSVQQARELDRDTLKLDISLQAALSYLNVLKARTFERIQRENLSLTRTNLELAQLRVSVGTAAPGEIFRWENQIANNRRALIDASAQTSIANIELNRLLNRPLDEQFLTVEAGLDDPELMISQQRFYTYLDTPRDFAVFRRFMAIEAVEAAPELGAIDALTVAQERVLLSARRSSWLPDFGVQAGFTGRMADAGAGSSRPSFSVGMFTLPTPGEADWFVGFGATLPLFEGGAKAAERARAQEEINRLSLERDATVERVEQRLQTSMHQMQASLLGIELSQQAADAAANNLRLVTDTYRRGAASIIDLLDAQNQALVADEEAANAVYDFLIDLMRVQRAVSRFDFFGSPVETTRFFDRLESFFSQARALDP